MLRHRCNRQLLTLLLLLVLLGDGLGTTTD